MAKEMNAEVSGTMIIGISNTFKNLSAITQIECDKLTANVEPDGWYPLAQLTDIFAILSNEEHYNPHLLFQAGCSFIQVWYDHGGKEMDHGSMGHLRMQDNSGGLKMVIRGHDQNVLYTKLLVLDEEKGYAKIESVSAFPVEFIRGIF